MVKEMERKYSSEFSASQPLKKIIPQLLLSLSIFSFIFSYYSPKFHYFSANSLQLLNKNCLFLLCNGLLVFLAKTSGLVRPPSDSDFSDMLQKKIGLETKETAPLESYVHDEPREEEEEKSGSWQKEVSILIAESEEEGGACDLEDVDKDDQKEPQSTSCWLFDDHDHDEEEEELYGGEVEEQEQEDEDDEKVELSTEELNQKFEDFIRKMKEEIIINEARQKAVVLK